MKRYILLLTFILLGLSPAFSQGNSGDAKIRAIKVALITDKMKLNAEQSSKFWPIYNRYENEMRVVWRGKNDLKNGKGMTAEEMIDERQKLDERTLFIKSKYRTEFLNVISASQLNAMYQAEAEFKKILIERLKN